MKRFIKINYPHISNETKKKVVYIGESVCL